MDGCQHFGIFRLLSQVQRLLGPRQRFLAIAIDQAHCRLHAIRQCQFAARRQRFEDFDRFATDLLRFGVLSHPIERRHQVRQILALLEAIALRAPQLDRGAAGSDAVGLLAHRIAFYCVFFEEQRVLIGWKIGRKAPRQRKQADRLTMRTGRRRSSSSDGRIRQHCLAIVGGFGVMGQASQIIARPQRRAQCIKR